MLIRAAPQFIDDLLQQAVVEGASDLHFEPAAIGIRIRQRLDGILHELTYLSCDSAAAIISRLKIMANLNIAERRLPQDGRFSFKSCERLIDCRVSTCPMLFGEKVVVRILDVCQMQRDINNLGFEPKQLALVKQVLNRPQGMILATGPTGSGKTVSLYALLSSINQADKNICSVEDPVEIPLSGLNQVNINPKANLDFATVLRAFLRQDPDVIMVGEMRDLQTAEIAMKASQTGHLVLSTLHTKNAVQSLIRLRQIGIASYTLAHCVSLIIAQRLVRRLCTHCKKSVILPKEICHEQGCGSKVYKAQGCEKCYLGYKGRLALYEVLPITNQIQDAILLNCDFQHLYNLQCQLGFESLRAMGLKKVAIGETSLDEINRVTEGSAL